MSAWPMGCARLAKAHERNSAMRTVTIQDVVRDPPKTHIIDAQTSERYRIDDDTVALIGRYVRPDDRTIETGAGLSTVLFALQGARHYCVTPDQGQVERIREYCAQRQISLEQVQFIVERSEVALPALRAEPLSFALIDGRHGFPAPFIDWYYIANNLKPGGIVVIDDLYIWTCDLLAQMLNSAPEWLLIQETSRIAAFSKNGDYHNFEWNRQAYVTARSRSVSNSAKVAYIARMLRQGKLKLLISNIAMRFLRHR